ncbi:MAG: mechanosensitive ion channel [Chloroflexota bacterium]|nr:mechanosensitive ion channel [Chloroflexota bacterium]
MPQLPAAYADIILKLVISLMILLFTFIAHRVLHNLLKVQIKDPTHMHNLYMLARNSILTVGGIFIAFVWLGLGSNLTLAMGILGAGIAFASQEIIGSFSGYINIVTGDLFRIGDRVRIGDVVGDVMDISILRTKVMEIGEWVHADQYTGRIVTLANRTVFSVPLFNYTQYWGYLWDEIMIPISYGSDWRRAGEIMVAHGQEYTSHIRVQAQAELDVLTQSYPVRESTVESTLYIVITDNWIEMTLRYVVESRQRRQVKNQLHLELLKRFESEPNITVASATVEIVGFPPLRKEEMV